MSVISINELLVRRCDGNEARIDVQLFQRSNKCLVSPILSSLTLIPMFWGTPLVTSLKDKCFNSCPLKQRYLGVLNKWRHAIVDNLWPLPIIFKLSNLNTYDLWAWRNLWTTPQYLLFCRLWCLLSFDCQLLLLYKI